MDIDTRLKDLGIELPEAPKPVAAYLPAVRAGGLLFVSGQLPFADGVLRAVGPVPSAANVPTAQRAARQCLLNALAIVRDAVDGDWTQVDRIVRLGVFVQSETGFADQPQVANGASELLVEVFGEPGRHARAAVGVNALPLNASVELELIVALTADAADAEGAGG